MSGTNHLKLINRTKSIDFDFEIDFERNQSISNEINRTKSNTKLCVSLISEPIEFNRTNRMQSNSIHWIVFDWVRLPNSVEHNRWMMMMMINFINVSRPHSLGKFAWAKVMLCGLTARLITVRKLWWTYIRGKPIENTFFWSFFNIIIPVHVEGDLIVHAHLQLEKHSLSRIFSLRLWTLRPASRQSGTLGSLFLLI